MTYRIKTTRHPDATGPWPLTHGPFATKAEADEMAASLRKAGKWGDVTVERGGAPQPNILRWNLAK